MAVRWRAARAERLFASDSKKSHTDLGHTEIDCLLICTAHLRIAADFRRFSNDHPAHFWSAFSSNVRLADRRCNQTHGDQLEIRFVCKQHRLARRTVEGQLARTRSVTTECSGFETRLSGLPANGVRFGCTPQLISRFWRLADCETSVRAVLLTGRANQMAAKRPIVQARLAVCRSN